MIRKVWRDRAPRRVNATVLRIFPTCDLQWALNDREGVRSFVLDPYERRSFEVEGACTVTVNRD